MVFSGALDFCLGSLGLVITDELRGNGNSYFSALWPRRQLDAATKAAASAWRWVPLFWSQRPLRCFSLASTAISRCYRTAWRFKYCLPLTSLPHHRTLFFLHHTFSVSKASLVELLHWSPFVPFPYSSFILAGSLRRHLINISIDKESLDTPLHEMLSSACTFQRELWHFKA